MLCYLLKLKLIIYLFKSLIKHKMPTAKGDKSETVSDETVMYVNSKGEMSIVPDNAVELPGMNPINA